MTYLLRAIPDVPWSIDTMVLSPHLTVPAPIDGTSLRLVGIGLPTSTAQGEMLEGHRLFDFAPAPADFVGFDVADASISAISNCGYGSESARNAAAQRWAGALDDRHLFIDEAEARRFVAFSDERVPEHAPFVVVALYVVRA